MPGVLPSSGGVNGDYVTKTTQDLIYYIDPTNGDDTLGDGSYSNPYASPQYIIDSILPDAIQHKVELVFKNGIYSFLVPDDISLPYINIDNRFIFLNDGELIIRGEGNLVGDSILDTDCVTLEFKIPFPPAFDDLIVFKFHNQKYSNIYFRSFRIRINPNSIV